MSEFYGVLADDRESLVMADVLFAHENDHIDDGYSFEEADPAFEAA